MEREERPLADLDQHVRELLLDELEGCNRPSELLPLFRVSQCGLVAVPRRPHRAPDDAVSGLAQAGEWSAEAPGFGQHGALREADVLESDVALDRSPHGELGRYICGREAFRVCSNEKASDGVLLFVSARPDYGDIGDGGQPDPTLPPFKTQSEPSLLAKVFMLAGSEPAVGSVRPKQPIVSPLAIGGSHLCFWSSDPNLWIALMAIEPCTLTKVLRPESPASSSMHARPYSTALLPAHP